MPTRDRTDLGLDELLLLWAARRSGVLDALASRAGTPEAVAGEAGVTDHAARVAVDALAELGFLRRVGGEYELTNRALGFLAKRDVRSIGRLPHALDVIEYLVALPETMETGSPPAEPSDWLRNRLGAHAATETATVRGCVTAAVRARPGANRVLDVRGAAGVYADEFAARGYDATLVDDAAVLEVVAPMYDDGPVSLRAGSPTALPAVGEAGPDIVFAADLLRTQSPAENRAFLEAAADVLAPNGVVVVTDVVGGADAPATGVAIERLALGSGGVYDAATVRDWFAAADLRVRGVRRVPGTTRHVVVGHRGVD